MDKKLKAKWVKALLSGKYPQGSGALYEKMHGGYCCLGVLCAVAGASPDELTGRGYPEDVEKYADVIEHDIWRKFADLNDDGGVPFEMLAGLIHEAL